jgi:hypothetical protein
MADLSAVSVFMAHPVANPSFNISDLSVPSCLSRINKCFPDWRLIFKLFLIYACVCIKAACLHESTVIKLSMTGVANQTTFGSHTLGRNNWQEQWRYLVWTIEAYGKLATIISFLSLLNNYSTNNLQIVLFLNYINRSIISKHFVPNIIKGILHKPHQWRAWASCGSRAAL